VGLVGDGVAAYRCDVIDQTTSLLALIAAAAVGIIGTLGILRRERHMSEEAARESPFAAATEGMKLCPSCGVSNLVTEATCSSCGKRLPG
jgi:hypothetical protein